MNKTPICTAPWTEFVLNSANANCCCFYSLEQEHLPFPSDRQSLMRIFNSKGFRDIRRRILDRDIKGTPCETCLERQLPSKDVQARAAASRTPAQAKAWQAALQSAQNGETTVSHTPVVFSLNTSGDCNLRCVMCYNSNLPADSIKGSLVPYENFISMLEDIGLETLTSIAAVGGETFLTRDALAIIKHLADRQDTGVRFTTNTNGSLLHKHHELLQKFKHLSLEISIEGYEDSYERIRRGASWPRLMENLEWCVQAAKAHPEWSLGINSVIMKSSLPHMKRIVELGRNRVGVVRFTPIMGDYHDENIFQFPDLLQGLPWREHFDEAVAATEAAGFPLAAQGLTSAKRRLEKTMQHQGGAAVFTGSSEAFSAHLRFIESQCPGDTIGIVGTRDCFADFLAWCRGKTTKRFTVTGKNITDTSRPYADWPTARLDALPPETDSLLYCCRTYEFAEYRAQVQRLHPQLPARVLPFWGQEVLRTVEELVAELGQRPVVLYAAGGAAELLLHGTSLGSLNVAAFSDGNPAKHGGSFQGKTIVPPAEIPAHAQDVVICSENYSHSIARDLNDRHGESLRVHRIF